MSSSLIICTLVGLFETKRWAAKLPFDPLRFVPLHTFPSHLTVSYHFSAIVGPSKDLFQKIFVVPLLNQNLVNKTWCGYSRISPVSHFNSQLLFCECQLTQKDRSVSLPFISTQLKKKKKNCQYEMALDEASPELAALACRFPDELDLRMCGSR